MAAVFDGVNLIVTLSAPTAGKLTVDVIDELYSDWKEWLKTNDAKFPRLFDVTGGDPIPGSQFISGSFFIRNDLGWRVQATDENQEISLIGNFYPRDETKDIFTPRAGRTATFNLNLTANPRDLSSAKVDDIHGQTIREVFIDEEFPTNGNFGYQQAPFNTWSAGIDYAEANNLLTIVTKTDATFDRLIKNFSIRGLTFPTIDLNGFDTDGTTIQGCAITGTHLGQLLVSDGAMISVTGEVLAQNVAIAGTYTVRGGSSSIITGVTPLTPGSPWTLDLGASDTASTVGLTNVSGGIILDNIEAGDVVHIHMAQGVVTINASCTGGEIVLTGACRLNDNSTGSTVTHDAVLHPEHMHRILRATAYRQFTNDATGKLDIYDDDDVLDQSVNIYEDDGVTAWDGVGPIVRRDKIDE